MLRDAASRAPPDAASAAMPPALLINIALCNKRAFAAVASVWKWLAKLCAVPYFRTVVAYVLKVPRHLECTTRNIYTRHGIDGLARLLVLNPQKAFARFMSDIASSGFNGMDAILHVWHLNDAAVSLDVELPWPRVLVADFVERWGILMISLVLWGDNTVSLVNKRCNDDSRCYFTLHQDAHVVISQQPPRVWDNEESVLASLSAARTQPKTQHHLFVYNSYICMAFDEFVKLLQPPDDDAAMADATTDAHSEP